MTENRSEYRPDFAPSPGELLEEQLEVLDISARELARRCGRSAKLISEIISGKAALEPETALQLERVLDIDANILLNMEAEYRLRLAREEDTNQLARDVSWAKSFPLKELQKKGSIDSPRDNADAVRKLLQFFGLASAEACREYFATLAISYRHSPSFSSDQNVLVSWIRLGELAAEKIACQEYDRSAFLDALRKIRTLTTKRIEILWGDGRVLRSRWGRLCYSPAPRRPIT
jgi:addiction module HigA family antidote